MSGTNNPDGFDKLLNQIYPSKMMSKVEELLETKPRLNLDKPRYDQSTFMNRFRHFALITSPFHLLKSDADLDKAKDIVLRVKRGDQMKQMSDDEIWEQKNIYDSAFHPDTGEKLIAVGRMCAQVPMNVIITGSMICLYNSNIAQVFLQWTNQTYNAIVNYSNRSGTTPISPTQIGVAYVTATAAGVGAALGLKSMAKRMPPVFGRLVPFLSVSASNACNIPIMRFGELSNGMAVTTEDGKEVGVSKIAARIGISQVILSRIAMATPTMICIPILMDKLEQKGVTKRHPWLPIPLQLFLCGAILFVSTPAGCALFPQLCPISPSSLEPELEQKIKKLPGSPTTVYYNKGL